jgi:translation elongation factor EF-Tu-like GTPase
MMTRLVVASARIRLLRHDEGGRLTAAASGYRPTIRFGDLYTAGALDLLDRDAVEPGEECEVRIRFPNPDYVEDFLRPQQKFDITEGPKKVGEGVILIVGDS